MDIVACGCCKSLRYFSLDDLLDLKNRHSRVCLTLFSMLDHSFAREIIIYSNYNKETKIKRLDFHEFSYNPSHEIFAQKTM